MKCGLIFRPVLPPPVLLHRLALASWLDIATIASTITTAAAAVVVVVVVVSAAAAVVVVCL